MYKSTNDPWKSKRRDLWYLGYTRHLAKSTRLNQPNDCISADVTCTGLVGGGVYVYTRRVQQGARLIRARPRPGPMTMLNKSCSICTCNPRSLHWLNP